ncbi:MAG: hypothetical protein H0U20_08325, partial [Thermoleophilaceae bacterium]|nr:hypothetical protein [Thermoleophilaceae bacterium]
MESTPAAATTEEPPREIVEEAPVTRDDLRALRRWILVAGVWAVAATAVALIALLDTSGDDAERTATGAANSATEAREAQGRLDKRLDKLDARLGDLPQAEDVSNLQSRLLKIEGEAKKASTDSGNAEDKVTDL